MLWHGAQAGAFELKRVLMETLISMRRAGKSLLTLNVVMVFFKVFCNVLLLILHGERLYFHKLSVLLGRGGMLFEKSIQESPEKEYWIGYGIRILPDEGLIDGYHHPLHPKPPPLVIRITVV